MGEMRVVWVVALLAGAGCDKLLDLQPIPPPFALGSGVSTFAAGAGHTCWIDSQGTLSCWGENDIGQLGTGSSLPEVDTIGPVDDKVWIAVSARHKHTCGLHSDHSLWCWGDGSNGRVGDGATDRHQTPVQPMGPATWLAVSAGTYHTCAIDEQHTLWCWGQNTDGEIGDGTKTDVLVPEQIDTNVAAVASGTYHTCAIHIDGSLECWGANGHGQLGDGTEVARPTIGAVGTEAWRAVAAGDEHSCGVTAAGHLRCWGYNDVGELGTAMSGDAQVPAAVLVDGDDRSDWIGVAASGSHTCAWTSGGDGYCFGDSSHGELGVATAVNATPLPIAGAWSAFAFGEQHVCAVDKSRALSCAGGNGWGQLGKGPTAVLQPMQVGTSSWSKVYAGTNATCVLDGSNEASCGGNNYYGQLGDGTQTSRSGLAPTAGGHGWSSLEIGADNVCAVEASTPQVVWCWGRNDDGESAHAFGAPVTMPTITTVVGPTMAATIQLSVAEHTCAAVSDPMISYGQTFCWGNNSRGQLGDGSTSARSTPTMIPNPPSGAGTFSMVGAGTQYTCGRVTDGSLWCWGRGDYGLNPTHADADTIQQLSPPTSMSQVFTGGNHACAIDNQGATRQAYCWGYNGEGQLGFASPGSTDTPMAASPQRWATLALGELHSCGIELGTNYLYCWGDNRRGQVGNGDPSRASVKSPVLVNTSQWRSIAAGAYYTCGVDAAGHLWCWGSDDDGALLDGNGWRASMMTVDVLP
jgi:alpha-tubulin suppressor-like RCC1 family protein